LLNLLKFKLYNSTFLKKPAKILIFANMQKTLFFTVANHQKSPIFVQEKCFAFF